MRRNRWGSAIGSCYSTGSYEHALSVWRRSLIAANGDDLAFMATLASHVVGCPVCPRTWIDGVQPVTHLENMLRKSPVRDIWRAVS